MKLTSYFKKLARDALLPELSTMRAHARNTLYLQGKSLAQSHHSSKTAIQDRSFRVHSQYGEDGILQGILMHLELPDSHRNFLEIGVEDYTEANTTFLLLGCSWRGSIIDSCAEALNRVRDEIPLWKYPLRINNGHVTTENVLAIVEESRWPGNLGVLSIDVDGNDYWIWDALGGLDADVVIVEYNALWGARASVSVQYSPDFDRFKEHSCGLYWGSSLRALWQLGKTKGYLLVATSDGGTNAFFVHSRHHHLFSEQSPDRLFRVAAAREARDEDGDFSFLSSDQLLTLLSERPLVDHTGGGIDCVGKLRSII